MQFGNANTMSETDIGVFVGADGLGTQRTRDGRTAQLDGAHFLRALGQTRNCRAMPVQLLAQLLHALQQPLALVQRELRLRERRVQRLLAPGDKNDLSFLHVCLGVFYNVIRNGNSRLVDKRGLSSLHLCLGVFYNVIRDGNSRLVDKGV
jgi:hypothetical protein